VRAVLRRAAQRAAWTRSQFPGLAPAATVQGAGKSKCDLKMKLGITLLQRSRAREDAAEGYLRI
jgi:hypothetical protein